MKKTIAVFLASVFIALAFCGCKNNDTSKKIDDILYNLEKDYSQFQKETEPSESVLDALDLMLDHFVSGLSTPTPSSIPNTVLDPDDQDAQDLISVTSSTVTDEAELEALILQSMKNVDSRITFEVDGDWLDWELLYEIVFDRIHDVYMIDAFGLYSYKATRTSNGTNDVYELTYTYIENCTPAEIRDMRYEIESQAKQIVRDLDLGGKSDYEIITLIDQYLCDNVYYPKEPYVPYDYTPYGTMFDGRAVCEGYSRTIKILCELCGVDCYYVTGYCDNDPVNGGHAWNLVGIDGKWYQLDTTWNDGGGNKDYFLVTDDYMSLSRTWDRTQYPASEQTAYTP